MGRHRRTRKEKNIRKDETTDEWVVYKKFPRLKKPHIYKKFRTFREAKKYRNSLDEGDKWITELPLEKKVKVIRQGRNYTVSKGGYTYIYKTLDYIQRFYGKYQTPEDAEKVIYHLILNDWNWDKIPDDIKKLRLPSKDPAKRYVTTVKNSSGHVVVRRHVHGENRNYGAYPDKQTADKVIDWLKENDWTLDLPAELKALQCQYRQPKHYTKTKSGKYNVHKSINGQGVHFGSYTNLDDAKHAIQELKKHNWDYKWFKKNKQNLNVNLRYNKRG